MRGLKGKVAIVTGGSRGIGRACVQRLLEEEVSVLFCGRNEEVGKNTLKELKEKFENVDFLAGNMIDPVFCKTLVAAAIEKFGRLDYLVNNAFPFTAKGVNATREDWTYTMEAGPISYATMIQEFVRQRGKENGSIVNMSSISGHIAQPDRWTYNAAKGAVKQLTRCAALDLSPGIRVNCISPGWVWTDEVKKAAPNGDEQTAQDLWGDFHMIQRLERPEEIASATVFLLSDDASAVTAADLFAEGGYLGLGPEGLGKDSAFAGSD
ncbi:MAG: SDR family oxidoreductase [Christensenella sp.]|uniref:SDR family NAD(P)-dependent oxidoreductase n=1 Tax=Christensenella sp. TaxID=1935934 RepID=UPI002B210A90|nr:SDR family oxidoreductase [Christensenella sp.]MEA5004247.1 SDR family oxidoreductase [Christensenella sp.]